MFPNQPPQAPPPSQPPAPQQWPSPEPTTPFNPGVSPLPTDYLNQIAPQAPRKAAFGLKQVIFAGIGLVILVLILAGVVGAFAGGKKEPLQRLSARLTATEVIAGDMQVNLKSSKLRSLNSNLKLYLTNTNRDITAPLMNAGVDVKKIDKSITAKESTVLLAGRLENARLNAVFDRTYAREMAYQLGTTMTLMTEIYNSTSSASLKAFLTSAYDNLKPTQESFATFSTTE